MMKYVPRFLASEVCSYYTARAIRPILLQIWRLGKYLPNLKIGSYDNSHAPEPVRAFLGKVVDVVGTLDECRFTFTYEGLHVSKEIARIYYRRTEWGERSGRSKEKGKGTRHRRLEEAC
jgi:hypothetical protein